jgi:DNA-binding response OmpR family regulator
MRVLWLATSGELAEVLRAFDAGADDVLRAPLGYAELRAHVGALLRRDGIAAHAVIECGALRIDTSARTATFGRASLDAGRSTSCSWRSRATPHASTPSRSC